MARQVNRLTVLKVKAIKAPGRSADGGGLYLYVSQTGNRSWVFRYRDRITGKLRDKGLGPLLDVTLEKARDLAANCRTALRDGKDPIDQKRQERIAAQVERSSQVTFSDCVTRYIKAHEGSWRNAKHAAQWASTIDTYAADLKPPPVSAIDVGHVLGVLEPIWATKTETATRVRQRIEAVLDWATARRYRKGENPARWRGHLQKLLPAPAKLKNIQHRAALPYPDAPALMRELAAMNTLAAVALRLQVLTATRPGEACAARWEEMDLAAGVWTIPATRMKAHREHRVPLAPELLRSLNNLARDDSGFLFPGKPTRSITTAATLKLLQGLRPGLTTHGFRSTFRDWAAEQTAYSGEVVEAALAHAIKDKTEAAYRRTDLLDRRKLLMTDWERYCSSSKAAENVVPIRTKSRNMRRGTK